MAKLRLKTSLQEEQGERSRALSVLQHGDVPAADEEPDSALRERPPAEHSDEGATVCQCRTVPSLEGCGLRWDSGLRVRVGWGVLVEECLAYGTGNHVKEASCDLLPTLVSCVHLHTHYTGTARSWRMGWGDRAVCDFG